jgi:hypothetical protein
MANGLSNKPSKYAPKEPTVKYYPEAGPARREGNLPIKALYSFNNQAPTYILPGTIIPAEGTPVPQVISYLSTESDNQITAENGNNIILE